MMKVGFQHIISAVPNQKGLRAADQGQRADPRQIERGAEDKEINDRVYHERPMEEGFLKSRACASKIEFTFLIMNVKM